MNLNNGSKDVVHWPMLEFACRADMDFIATGLIWLESTCIATIFLCKVEMHVFPSNFWLMVQQAIGLIAHPDIRMVTASTGDFSCPTRIRRMALV